MQDIKPFYKRLAKEEEYICKGQDKSDQFIYQLTQNSHHMDMIRKMDLCYQARNKFTHFGMLEFSSKGWDQLTLLNLISNKVGNKGCKYLSRVSFKNLQFIALDDNEIGSSGVLHLSKTNWNMKEGITFSSNKISIGSAGSVNRSRWKSTTIQLDKNKLNAEEVKQFILSQMGDNVYVFLKEANMTFSIIYDQRIRNKLRQFFKGRREKFLYDL